MRGIVMILALFIFSFCFPAFSWLKDVVELLPHEKQLKKEMRLSQVLKIGRDLHIRGCPAEALSFFKVALKKNPKNPEVIEECGNTYFTLGNVEFGVLGWASMVYERKNKLHPKTWRGEDVRGKTIVIDPGWGFGDSFLLVRYLQLLKNQGARVIFRAPRALAKIMSLCPFIDQVMTIDIKPKHFDYILPAYVLPYHFNASLSNLPLNIPYMFADERLKIHWRQAVAKDKNFKIGICWQGAIRKDHPAMQLRSMPLNLLAPLFSIEGVSIYSLQAGDGLHEVSSFQHKDKLHSFANFDKHNGPFMDTAALMKNLDLVITIDTSICHLAGALGVPVWVMLSHICDCRTFMHRPDNPWYPTMRHFRQQKPGNWQQVVQEVTEALKQHLAIKRTVTLMRVAKSISE